MALISCPECRTSVSDKASACPSCGVQIRKPKRGVFGIIFKWLFIGFNLFMAVAMWNGMSAVGQLDNGNPGTALGAGVGFAMILVIWALGAVILGLLTIITRAR